MERQIYCKVEGIYLTENKWRKERYSSYRDVFYKNPHNKKNSIQYNVHFISGIKIPSIISEFSNNYYVPMLSEEYRSNLRRRLIGFFNDKADSHTRVGIRACSFIMPKIEKEQKKMDKSEELKRENTQLKDKLKIIEARNEILENSMDECERLKKEFEHSVALAKIAKENYEKLYTELAKLIRR